MTSKDERVDVPKGEVCTVAWYLSHSTPYGRAEMRYRVETMSEPLRIVRESPVFKGDATFGPNRRIREHVTTLNELVLDLIADGWISLPRGDQWYSERFQRESSST